jgi:hypothetical protein
MPLDNYSTRPDFSRQIKQYSGTTALLSGATNILQKFSVKNIEIDTINPQTGHLLIYNGTKFVSAPLNSYGDVILNGMSLSYYTGLTYNISNGSYRVNGATYIYTGGTVNINSGNSLHSRFDIVYVTGDSKSFDFVLSGIPSAAPTVPSLNAGQLQVGIISVPANFTGGTGSTIIQVTSNTVFDYYAGGTGIFRAGAYNAEAVGQYSFAPSRDAKAYGQDSIAMGLGTQASGNSQTVVGQFNSPNTDDYFIVGNGTSDGSRANAFRVTTGGSAYVTNKLFVTNVEIETTGASTNQALVYDGTKFKPQSVLSTGTSLGNGIKVLFSSDTTSLSFVTLSSQTPSSLRIISSSTGVILFSATTTSGGISGTYVSGITSAGTGNILLLSSITNNNLIHKSISAGTGMQITESNGTLLFVSTATGGTSTGNFLPLSGGTLTGGLSATTISATSIDRINYIDFNTGTTVNPNFGRLFFNGTEQSLSYFGQGITEIKIGQQLYSRVYNNTGGILTKGTAVKVTGATLGLPTICPAIASHIGDNTVIGLVANNIANNSEGLVINNGLISGLTLNNFVVGDTLYLSPVSAGTYVNNLTGYGFNIRTNVIGRVVATGTTTGQIYVKTDNEDSTLSLTNLERNIVEGNVISTGVYEFTGLTTGSTNTTFNVSPARGWVVQNTYVNATTPEVDNLYYTGGTNISVTNIATADATYLLINSAATLVQQTTFPTPQERRQNIFIGKVVHPNRSTILALNNTVDYDVSPISSLRDLWTPIKLINDGITPSANTGLTFQTSSGRLWGNGIGWASNQLNPNSINISAKAPASFFYRTRTGGTSSAVTNIDPTKYDLNGVITSVGGAGSDDSTNQRIYLYPTGVINVLYGQTVYNNLAAAVAGIQSESFVTYSNASSTGILIGILSIRNDAAPTGDDEPLSNPNYAVFTPVSKFGELLGGTGGLSTTTLQQAYDNSTNPEIVTNSAEGALTIKNGAGTADNVTNLFEGQSSTSTITSFIKADGTISGLTFLGDASNLTGVLSKTNLFTTLTVSSTTKTVPLNTFYLYDKITLSAITSTETVTAITSNASISTYTPSIKFFAQTGITITFKNSTTLKTEGGLDAVIVGSNYDSITFTYNNDIQKYFQTNINNYI